MKVGKTIEFFVTVFSQILIGIINIKNNKKKRVLLYTDSRGFEITKVYNKRNPFSSYVRYFIKNYRCKVYVCPEKHTTIFDFIWALKKQRTKFDYIVAHVGVVDFSPRPISQIETILSLKKEKIVSVFGENYYNKLLKFEGYKKKYEGNITSSILPEQYIAEVATELNKIDNFYWISCNPVIYKWNGNYPRKRPININIVNSKSKLLIQLLTNAKVVDLTDLNRSEIKEYTCDNIHLTSEGMNYIVNKTTDHF